MRKTKNLCFVKCGFFFLLHQRTFDKANIEKTTKAQSRYERKWRTNGWIQINEITKQTERHLKKKKQRFLLLRLSRWRSAFTFDSLQSIEKPFFFLIRESVFIYSISNISGWTLCYYTSQVSRPRGVGVCSASAVFVFLEWETLTASTLVS